MNQCNRTYSNYSETMYRRYIFYQNQEFIDHQNSLNNSYQLSMNCFGDLTHQEFSNKILMNPIKVNGRNHSLPLHNSSLH